MKLRNETPSSKAENEPDDSSRRSFLKASGAAAIGAVIGVNGSDKIAAAAQTAPAENKFINKEGNCEFVFTSPDPSKAHESANTFANEIGNILKSAYPSKVVNPSVNLSVFIQGGQKLYRLTWRCQILKASVTDANYYFDRRGTLLPGSTLAEAKRKVENELERSGKVSAMRKNFRGAKIYENFIKDSFSGSNAEGYWYIKEFFMVAPK